MAYGIPSPGETSLLVALLTELELADEALLLQRLHETCPEDYSVQLWHPPKVGLPQPISKRRDRRDSKANIYGLAVLAHRAGRASFYVVDRLTKRQLQGDPRPGEDPSISMVMVSVRSSLHECEPLRVIAKRHTLDQDGGQRLPNLLSTFELSYQFLGGASIDITTRLSEYGLELHDPDHAVFTRDTVSATGREEFECAIKAALSESTPLPTELIASIVSTMDHRTQIEPVSSPTQSDALTLFLTFPTEEDERNAMRAVMERELQLLGFQPLQRSKEDDTVHHLAVQLVPWEYSHPATRRDLENHWQEIHEPTLCPLNYLLAPLETTRKSHVLEKAQLGSIYHSNDGFILMARNSLAQMAAARLNRTELPPGKFAQLQNEWHENQRLDPAMVEFLIGPDDPFYNNPPSWAPVNGEGLVSISVFYLTNKLSKEQTQALRAEFYEGNGDLDGLQKACCYVAWADGDPDAPDGTVDDIWRIFWDLRRHTSCEMPIFFVDEQSGVNQTVIMVDCDHFFWASDNEQANRLLQDVEDPSTKGILCGRLKGRKAHDAFCNLSIGNMNFEEFLESFGQGEEHHYPRPGWPGHGILEDED
ncbi:hypothetical protein N7462_008183 [Penicillium macrosclerotiorum]|uniref:uncharacterized protein n=1 Tax=Penicillium macrosclerotiorum TaxID=303699 RepID=UPI002548545A|nr:uncharacterized protein N7462_008183 [Penicillium macrosclerotiorum]KAJ5679939.1 hypothetical protein N7462_008183 [Penicillium macrosclerotiorum]